MAGYFAGKGERWPAVEAEELLRQVRVGRDHRWTSSELLGQAGTILARAMFQVDDLIENHLKVSMSYDSLAYLDKSEGTQVYGCAYPQTREVVICERTLRYEPLFRTTAAHELGHVLMHGETQQRCMLYTPQRPASTPEEREANAFMTAIILPDAVLDLAVRYVCGIWGIDTRFAFDAANSARGRWVWREKLFATLINRLCVSREMVSITMKQWGFFDEDTFAYHKSYALETKWHTPAPREAIGPSVRRVMRDLYNRARLLDAEGVESGHYIAGNQRIVHSPTGRSAD